MHPPLTDRQRDVLRARCETASRKAAADRLGVSVWAVHRVLLSIPCCKGDEAMACWEHRAELETAKT